MSAFFQGSREHRKNVWPALRATLFGAEHTRSRAAAVRGQMSIDLMASGVSPEEVLGTDNKGGAHLLSALGAGKDKAALEKRLAAVQRGETPRDPNAGQNRQMVREVEMIRACLITLADPKFDDNASADAKRRSRLWKN